MKKSLGKRKKLIYSIVHTNHCKIKNVLDNCRTKTEAYKSYKKLLADNKREVVFPVRYNNEKDIIVPSDHEILLVKYKEFFDEKQSMVRGDDGEYVMYEADSDEWLILERDNYNVEETFWVYGYHPRMGRKTFSWILENLLLNDTKNKDAFKTVCVYNNKVLIECNGKLDIVTCKNRNDSARMFNMMESVAKKNKCRYIIFMGDIRYSKFKGEWEKKIAKLTGWNDKKIKRASTRD